ncbi:hypothetical protein KCU77_g506, partial [Aureobasidium melanogenum]
MDDRLDRVILLLENDATNLKKLLDEYLIIKIDTERERCVILARYHTKIAKNTIHGSKPVDSNSDVETDNAHASIKTAGSAQV